MAKKNKVLNFSPGKDDPEANFHIFDHKGCILEQKKTIKILSYTINKTNDLDNHLSILYGKINSTFHQIRGALSFLDKKNRKIIITLKLKGQLNLTLPLLLSQNECVQSRAEVLLMKINKRIYGQSVFKVGNEKICLDIGNPLPTQEILRVS